MTDRTLRRQSVSRRTMMAGTAGMLGGAALTARRAFAQAPAPAASGAAVNSPSNPSGGLGGILVLLIILRLLGLI